MCRQITSLFQPNPNLVSNLSLGPFWQSKRLQKSQSSHLNLAISFTLLNLLAHHPLLQELSTLRRILVQNKLISLSSYIMERNKQLILAECKN